MILLVLYILFSPIIMLGILIGAFLNNKIKHRLFGIIPSIIKSFYFYYQYGQKKDIIVTHAASIGEFEQLIPVLMKLDRKKYFILQTFYSPTAYLFYYNKETKYFDICCYMPFDFIWSVISFFALFKPKFYIITRHDVWPIHILVAKLFRVKIAYINANIYFESKRLNFMLKNMHQAIYNIIDYISVPTSSIKNIFLNQLNLSNQIKVISDTRYERINNMKNLNLINNQLFDKKKHVILLGSIDNRDFLFFKKYFLDLSNKQKNRFKKICQFIIAPHELNYDLINAIIQFSKLNNMSYVKYSEVQLIKNKNIIIIDTIGDLKNLYFLADISYIGGGLKGGVHSIFEAAIYNSIISHGPNYGLLHDAVDMQKKNISYIIKNYRDFYFINDLLVSKKNMDNKKQQLKKFISQYNMQSSNQIISYLHL